MAETFRLRPMDLRDILDETFDLYKENFVLFFILSAVFLLPFQLLMNLILGSALLPAANAGPTGPNPADLLRMAPTFGVTTFFATIVYYIVIGALTQAVSERYLGHKIAIRPAYDAILTRLRSFIGTLVLALLAVIGGEIVLIGVSVAAGAAITAASPIAGGISLIFLIPAVLVGGALYWILFVFVIPVFVVERRGGQDALSRSMRLVLFSPLKTFSTLFLITVIVGLLTAILVMPLSLAATLFTKNPPLYFLFRAFQGAFNGLVQALLQPIKMIVVLLLYYDARIRKEGFDLEVMAGELRASSTGPGVVPPYPEDAGAGSGERITPEE